jgi:membrane fusion protein (multidrug efflux system)
LQTVGQVKSADEVYVVSQTQGEINKVHVKIGERVKKGDVIAQIDDYYSRQEYNMAKLAYDQFKKDFNRYTELAKVDAITQQQLEQLRLQLEGAQTKVNSLEKRLGDYLIKAPLDGVINQLFVSRGNATGLGMPVCELVGGSFIKIDAKVNPNWAKYLRVGVKASITSDFGHGERYVAQLAEIGQKAGKFGSVAAIFILATEEKKSPETGSLVNIQVEIAGNPELLLPRQALTNKEGKIGLFVLKQNNVVEFTPVKYLNFDDSFVSVLDSNLNNKQIIVEGNYMLETGDLVKVVR